MNRLLHLFLIIFLYSLTSFTVVVNSDAQSSSPPPTPPVFTEGASTTRTVAENSPINTYVGTPITATDADNSGTLTYRLSGRDRGYFKIRTHSAQIRTRKVLNYETDSELQIQVVVTDGVLTDTIDVTVNVTDVNENPVFTEGSSTTRSIPEDASWFTRVGTPVLASHPTGERISYSLSGAGSKFIVVRRSGQIRTYAALDYEQQTSHTFTLTATDNDNNASSIQVTVNVTDVDDNRPPTFDRSDSYSKRFYISADTAIGSNVGTPIVATDPDGDTLTYGMSTDSAAEAFNLDQNGQLTSARIFGPDSPEFFLFHINVSDGEFTDIIHVIVYIIPVITPVEDRTPAVRDEIVRLLSNRTRAEDVTKEDLLKLDELTITNTNTSSLKRTDFDGLTNVYWLNLENNALTELQDNVFAELSGLETLLLDNNQISSVSLRAFDGVYGLKGVYLDNNQIASLPAGVFRATSSIQQISLGGNALTSVESNVFSNLPNLTNLYLHNNQIASIADDAFSGSTNIWSFHLGGNNLTEISEICLRGLTKLKQFALSNNQLTLLPVDIFKGKKDLNYLWLRGNNANPIPLRVDIIRKVSSTRATIKVIIPVCAPYDMQVPITVTNGRIVGGNTVTVLRGTKESAYVTVKRTEDTGRVTVNIGTMPSLPRNHNGYNFVKDATLPITVIK